MRYLLLLIMLYISAIITGCFNADQTSNQQPTIDVVEDQDSVAVTYEILVGGVYTDKIIMTVIDSTSQVTYETRREQMTEDKAFFNLMIPADKEIILTYTCFNKEELVASNIKTITLFNDTTIASTPDKVPVFITSSNDTTMNIGDKISFSEIKFSDDSKFLKFEYDHMGNGTFQDNPQYVYKEEGTFFAIICISDSFHTIYDTVVVTVENFSFSSNRATSSSSNTENSPVNSSANAASNSSISETMGRSSSATTQIFSSFSPSSSSKVVSSSVAYSSSSVILSSSSKGSSSSSNSIPSSSITTSSSSSIPSSSSSIISSSSISSSSQVIVTISIEQAYQEAQLGLNYQLNAIVSPLHYKDSIQWASNNTGVLVLPKSSSIKDTAMASALDFGLATITASVGAVNAQCTVNVNIFEDSRDSQTYKTTIIGSQVWMAENLRYMWTYQQSSAPTDSAGWCYDAPDKNWFYTCADYGRYYIVDQLGGVCPAGWHAPSVSEFDTLVLAAQTELGSFNITYALKSSDFWYTGAGTNQLGFNARPSGYGTGASNPTFSGKDTVAYFWTTDRPSYLWETARNITIEDTEFKSVDQETFKRLPVRCVKDD